MRSIANYVPRLGGTRAPRDNAAAASRREPPDDDAAKEISATRTRSQNLRNIALFLFWPVFLSALWNRFEDYKVLGFRPQMGDWLINYEGGFVRRGLLGQVIYYLSRYVLHANGAAIAYSIQIAVYLAVAAALTFLVLHKESRWHAWMLLSPAGLLYIALDPPGGYRKEELLFLSLLAVALARGRAPKARNALVMGGVSSFFFVVLSWEGALFFLPFFLACLHASLGGGAMARRATASTAIAAVACGALLARFHGDAHVEDAVRRSFHAMNVPPSVAGVDYLHDTFAKSLRGSLLPERDHVHYLLSFALSAVPFVACGWVRRHKTLALVALVVALPQYLVACDFGRWIHAFVVSATIHWLAVDAEEPPRISGFRLPGWLAQVALMVWCSTWSFGHYNLGFRRDANLLTELQAVVRGR